MLCLGLPHPYTYFSLLGQFSILLATLLVCYITLVKSHWCIILVHVHMVKTTDNEFKFQLHSNVTIYVLKVIIRPCCSIAMRSMRRDAFTVFTTKVWARLSRSVTGIKLAKCTENTFAEQDNKVI